MFSLRILSGLIAAYLVAAPCLVIEHGNAHAESNGNSSLSYVHDDHGHEHGSESSSGDEHCCEDLSGSIHAPLKQIPIASFATVVPSFEIQIPLMHPDQRIALTRDGPLYEKANDFAKTIVIRS